MGAINFMANIMPTVKVPGLDGFIGRFLEVLNGNIGNICLTMIVFTVILKLITLPLDFVSRKTAKTNQIVQERLKPQLDKIDKQCGDDKRLAQQRKTMLMRKSGYKTLGACLPVLISLGLMIYVFSAVNSFTTHTTANIYNEMTAQYSELAFEENENGEYIHVGLTEDDKQIMIEKYESLAPRFLWIKNPYRPDAWQSAVASYNDFKSGTIGVTGLKIEDEYAENYYQQTMGSIMESEKYKGWNGFMILPILAAIVSFLSQFFLAKLQPQPQAAGGGAQSEKTMKIMRFISPLMTLYFSFMYTSGFAIYLLFNSLLTFGLTLLMGKIVNKVSKKKEREFQGQQSYRRR